MNFDVSTVYLRSGDSGELVLAKLYDAILPIHVDQHELLWRPLLAARDVEHGHWNWRTKLAEFSGLSAFRSFAIELAGVAQGLMIVNTQKLARVDPGADKRIVYVEYLESAPWNRATEGTGLDTAASARFS